MEADLSGWWANRSKKIAKASISTARFEPCWESFWSPDQNIKALWIASVPCESLHIENTLLMRKWTWLVSGCKTLGSLHSISRLLVCNLIFHVINYTRYSVFVRSSERRLNVAFPCAVHLVIDMLTCCLWMLITKRGGRGPQKEALTLEISSWNINNNYKKLLSFLWNKKPLSWSEEDTPKAEWTSIAKSHVLYLFFFNGRVIV